MTTEQKRVLREKISLFGNVRWNEGFYDGQGYFDGMREAEQRGNFLLNEIEKILNELS